MALRRSLALTGTTLHGADEGIVMKVRMRMNELFDDLRYDQKDYGGATEFGQAAFIMGMLDTRRLETQDLPGAYAGNTKDQALQDKSTELSTAAL